jgi:hypothetical protein
MPKGIAAPRGMSQALPTAKGFLTTAISSHLALFW